VITINKVRHRRNELGGVPGLSRTAFPTGVSKKAGATRSLEAQVEFREVENLIRGDEDFSIDFGTSR